MNKEEGIKKFLENLNKSEEGKRLLKEANPQAVVPEVMASSKEELVVEPKKEDKKGKKKKNDNWWSKTFNKDKLKKSTKVAVIYLRNNGNADLIEVETRNGFFSIEGKPYHEERDCIYTITKDRIPLMIQREWDIIPLGTKKWDDDSMREKFSEVSQHLLRGIKNAAFVRTGGGFEGKLTPKQLILWGLVALVGVIIIMNFI